MAEKTYSSKALLKEHAEKGTKISYDDRKEVEVVKATKHLTVGTIFAPHKVKADALIAAGIAKEYKRKD